MVPVLSSTTVLTLCSHFQRFGGLDEDAVFRAHAGADHDRHGGGQTQCAGAGDHQHCNADGQCKLKRHAAAQQPDNDRHNGDGDDGRGRIPLLRVSASLAMGALVAAGFLHQADDLGKRGVRAHAGRFVFHIARSADRGGNDVVPRPAYPPGRSHP